MGGGGGGGGYGLTLELAHKWLWRYCDVHICCAISIVHRGSLSINMPSYQYSDSHVKLAWESPYLRKTVSILWRGPGTGNYVISNQKETSCRPPVRPEFEFECLRCLLATLRKTYERCCFHQFFQYRLQMTQETMGLIWGIFSGQGEQDRWNNWEFVDMIQHTGLLLTILRQKIN